MGIREQSSSLVLFLTVPIEAHDVLKGRLKVTTIRSSHGPLTLSFHLQIQSPWEEKFHTARGYISATSAHWKCSSQENKRNALARPYKLAPAHKTQQSRKSAFIPLLVTMFGFSGQQRAYVHEDPCSLLVTQYHVSAKLCHYYVTITVQLAFNWVSGYLNVVFFLPEQSLASATDALVHSGKVLFSNGNLCHQPTLILAPRQGCRLMPAVI